MMPDAEPIAVFGGTFDPVHKGHIAVAEDLQQKIKFSQMRFIPCKQPVLKAAAHANSVQRLAMLELALADHPDWHIDTRELDRDTPSYMIETLQSLRADLPQSPLCLVLGMDAFNQLPKWHQWQQLLTLAHIIVIKRPQHPLDQADLLKNLIKQHQTDELVLLRKLQGHILFLDLPPHDISSTRLRAAIAAGEDVGDQLPAPVWAYIKANKLYL